MSSFVGTTTDSGGWNPSHTVTNADNSLIFVGLGTTGGSPGVTAVSSDQDGAADFFGLLTNGGAVLCYAVWFNASAALHGISVSRSNITPFDSILTEVANIDEAASALEDFDNTATSTTTTSHPTGSVTAVTDAILIAGTFCDGNPGSPTYDSLWSELYDGGAGILQGRALTSGATDDGDWTGTNTVSTESFIIAFKGSTPDASGGNQNFLTLLGVG